MEKKADKKWYPDIDDFRCQKLRAGFGWNILMWGIAIETVVAGVFAARDGLEIRQINASIPAKMRVNSVEATAEFFIQTNLDDPGTTWGEGRAKAILTLFAKTNLPVSTNDLQVLMSCDDVKWIPIWNNPQTGENGSSVTLYFKIDPLWGEYFSATAFNKPAEELLKELKYFALTPNFLYGNTTRFSHGKVTLVLNGSVSKTFEIPDQKVDLNPRRAIETNSLRQIPAKWFINNF